MTADLSPELDLMVAGVRRVFGQSCDLPEHPTVDWARFEQEVFSQGLGPMMHSGLCSRRQTVPLDLQTKLQASYAVTGFWNQVHVRPALISILAALTEEGLAPVVLKGAALAYLTYPKPAHRTMADIDLLLAPAELPNAEHTLLARGLRRSDNQLPIGHHHLPPLTTADGKVLVELHDRLVSNECPYAIDLPAMMERSQVHYLAGTPVRVLSPDDSLFHVSVHVAYGHRYRWFPLRSLIDIMAISQAHPDLDWDRLLKTATQSQAEGAVYWPLLLAHEWLRAPIPPDVLRGLAPRRLGRLFQGVLTLQHVVSGEVPPLPGSRVLYNALCEWSLCTGCSWKTQSGVLLRSLFPRPHEVGHLPPELTRSRVRYGAYLSRPVRLVRGAVALIHLMSGVFSHAAGVSDVSRNANQTQPFQGTFAGGSSSSGAAGSDEEHKDMLAERYQPILDSADGRAENAKLSVVIPALDEEDGIAAIIERIEAVREPLAQSGVADLEIIVVDDGSKDRTADIAASYPSVRLMRHAKNRGYGAAIKTGFNSATGNLLAFTDADGTYPPERFPQLCKVALDRDADVVVGSRRSGERSEMPRVRRVGNFIWSNLVSVIGNRRVADPASGMRVVRASALPKLYPLPDGLNFTPVMSTRCVHENLKVIEVPIPYKERLGRSKLSIVKDGSRFLKTILWTSLEYNPVRVLGLAGVTALALAAAIGLGILSLRLQGVTQLREWGTFSVFAALVLAVAGVSIFSLGAMFNYLVSLFRGEAVRQGLFGTPLFSKPLDRHFGWLGLASAIGGIGLAVVSLILTLNGVWDTARLSLWLLGSALLLLVGLQLVVSWIVMRVLETLTMRNELIEQEMRPLTKTVVGAAALAHGSVAD